MPSAIALLKAICHLVLRSDQATIACARSDDSNAAGFSLFSFNASSSSAPKSNPYLLKSHSGGTRERLEKSFADVFEVFVIFIL
jgi:hypothetical protein